MFVIVYKLLFANPIKMKTFFFKDGLQPLDLQTKVKFEEYLKT